MTDWIIPFLCGLGASILSAWGVGGGTLLLLVMTLFLDVDQRTAQGINLLFFLPTAASALVCHARGGYLDKPYLSVKKFDNTSTLSANRSHLTSLQISALA